MGKEIDIECLREIQEQGVLIRFVRGHYPITAFPGAEASYIEDGCTKVVYPYIHRDPIRSEYMEEGVLGFTVLTYKGLFTRDDFSRCHHVDVCEEDGDSVTKVWFAGDREAK
jgi:hypothetical protein